MPIDEIIAVIAPPRKPLENFGDWEAAEIIVGAEFPTDFRDLVGRYGSGAFFRGYVHIYNPLTLVGLAHIKEAERRYRICHEGLYPCPFPIHPEKPGLLPWGGDDNGNGYFWLTKGKPAKWPVIYLGHGSEDRPLQFRADVTTFLAGYATDRFKSLARPEEPFTQAERVFTPGRNWGEVQDNLPKSRKGKSSRP